MQAHEIAVHLREILVRWGCPPAQAALYTSHSLNVTLLSWCAKVGVPLKARRILGYHAKAGDRTTLVYSRDVLAWPLRHLGKTIALVARGFFDPDATRSGRWGPQQPIDSADRDFCDQILACGEDAARHEGPRWARSTSGDTHSNELAKVLAEEWNESMALEKAFGFDDPQKSLSRQKPRDAFAHPANLALR